MSSLKFFGGIALFLGMIGMLSGGFMAGWYLWHRKTSPFTSLIPISGIFLTLGFEVLVLALLADMLGRQQQACWEMAHDGLVLQV